VSEPLQYVQVLAARRPAYSTGHLFRYMPGEGFQRANLFSHGYGIEWLPVEGKRGMTEEWFHEEGCDCRYCARASAVRAASRRSPHLPAWAGRHRH